MNPIRLKPMARGRCQVTIHGQPVEILEGRHDRSHTDQALQFVQDALAELRARFDLILIEGMGSPVEINLRDREVANMPTAVVAGAQVLLIGGVERGGVFAALAGTIMLLSAEERRRLVGCAINKFHGDPAVLKPGLDEMEAPFGLRTLGVLPYISHLRIEEEKPRDDTPQKPTYRTLATDPRCRPRPPASSAWPDDRVPDPPA